MNEREIINGVPFPPTDEERQVWDDAARAGYIGQPCLPAFKDTNPLWVIHEAAFKAGRRARERHDTERSGKLFQ